MKRLLVSLLLLLVGLAGWVQLAEDDAAAERKPGLYATLETSMGNIVLRLFEQEAPKTVENFVELATGKKAWRNPRTGEEITGKPYYDGLIFHRVIPDFMIQMGEAMRVPGQGPGYTIPDEFDSNLKFDRPGRVGMANIGQPNTGGAQFFITHVPTPWLSGKHTIFGQVVEGQSVVDAIGKVPRDSGDRPRTPVTLNKVTIERVEAKAD